MSKLTLDKAIKHCLEVAEQKEHDSITTTGDHELDIAMKEGCIQCAADHRQLAEWLMEYKDLKAEQNDQYVFIHELMSELKEAKRLLKLAIEDIYNARRGFSCKICDMPKNDIDVEKRCEIDNVQPECKYRWRYADEALKLIGDESNGI